MQNILYYSNRDEVSREVTQALAALPLNFICVDKQSRAADGKTYCTLQDGSQVLLPQAVGNNWPAMVVIADGKSRGILHGKQILDFYRRPQQPPQQQVAPVESEPMDYTTSTFGRSSGLCAVSAFGESTASINTSVGYGWVQDGPQQAGGGGGGGMSQNPNVDDPNWTRGNTDDTPKVTQESGQMDRLNREREEDEKRIFASQTRSEY
jgi:hypothetical protein